MRRLPPEPGDLSEIEGHLRRRSGCREGWSLAGQAEVAQDTTRNEGVGDQGHQSASCAAVLAGQHVDSEENGSNSAAIAPLRHCDANLAAVSWRENVEESGITPAFTSVQSIDVDIHQIPARPGEPEHDHLDTRHLLIAPEGAQETISEESIDLRWFTREEARQLELDESVTRLLEFAPHS